MDDIICLRYPLVTGTVCWYLRCCFSWMERHRLVFFLPKLILFCCLLILRHSLFGPFSERMLWTIILLYTFWSDVAFTRSSLSMWESLDRAVINYLSSRLLMNSRRLCNSHQRHKFLTAKASRDILKLRVLEIAFPQVFKRYFHCRCHVALSEYTQDWKQCRLNVPGVPWHCTVWRFHRSERV